MDSITQIVLGAAVGEACLGKKVGNKAMLWGAIAGTIPDLDVFTKLFVDQLTADELHRGFSHSILFSIIFAPIFGWAVYKLYAVGHATRQDWTKLFFLSLVTHPMLDAHTAWGTQLLWPLPYKITYNNIFVIDPLYTVPFMVCLLLAMRKSKLDPKRQKLNNLGLYISCSYMVLTLIIKGYSHYQITKNLAQQQIIYSELECKPTPFNSILWCGFIKADNEILIGYYSLLDGNKPIKFKRFKQNNQLLGKWKNDDKIRRLKTLSRGWYLVEKTDTQLYFIDVRFGQIGFSNQPLSFVFSRELVANNGALELVQRRPEFQANEIKNLFRRIYTPELTQ